MARVIVKCLVCCWRADSGKESRPELLEPGWKGLRVGRSPVWGWTLPWSGLYQILSLSFRMLRG